MFTYVHLLLGVAIGAFIKWINPSISIFGLLLFILGNVIIDLDHMVCVIIYRKSPYREVRMLIRAKKISDVIEFLKENHKEFNQLIFHNFISFMVFIGLFEIAFHYNNPISLLFLGILTHSVMDQIDDLYVLKSLKNWLWFSEKIRKNNKSIFLVFFSLLVVIIDYLRFLQVI